MMRKTIALAALAGAALLVSPLSASAAVAHSARAPQPKSLYLRGGLTLTIPGTWTVSTRGDWTQVITGACTRANQYFGATCDSFWVLGPKAIKVGHEIFRPYTPDQPFYPATDVEPCPSNQKLYQVTGKATAISLRQVGRGHKADYREWPGRCVKSGGKAVSYFTQREWYLPKTRILVVDQWSTPGLSGILKRATWK